MPSRTGPNLLALEDAGQCLYVFNSLFLAVLPAVLAARLWSRMGVPMAWAIGGGIAMLFPILLLSMLAANSPLHLLSLRVWRSLLGGGLAWIGFHLTTFAAGLAVAALEIALWRHAGWAVDVAVTAVVAAVGWMVYFRLLGRLALLLHSHLGGYRNHAGDWPRPQQVRDGGDRRSRAAGGASAGPRRRSRGGLGLNPLRRRGRQFDSRSERRESIEGIMA